MLISKQKCIMVDSLERSIHIIYKQWYPNILIGMHHSCLANMFLVLDPVLCSGYICIYIYIYIYTALPSFSELL